MNAQDLLPESLSATSTSTSIFRLPHYLHINSHVFFGLLFAFVCSFFNFFLLLLPKTYCPKVCPQHRHPQVFFACPTTCALIHMCFLACCLFLSVFVFIVVLCCLLVCLSGGNTTSDKGLLPGSLPAASPSTSIFRLPHYLRINPHVFSVLLFVFCLFFFFLLFFLIVVVLCCLLVCQAAIRHRTKAYWPETCPQHRHPQVFFACHAALHIFIVSAIWHCTMNTGTVAHQQFLNANQRLKSLEGERGRKKEETEVRKEMKRHILLCQIRTSKFTCLFSAKLKIRIT